MNDQKPKTQFWKTCGIFLTGSLVGAVLALGSEVALKQAQLSKNEVEIKLPPTNSTTATIPSPSPQFTIPPPPNASRQSQPQASQPPTTPPIPASQPSTPSLANVPKLPSTSPTPSPSPTLAGTEQVSFEAGATGTTVRDSLQPNQSKRYTFKCSSNQQMTVKIEEGIVSVDVIAPDGAKIGAAVGALQWQGQLKISGDYTLEVSTPKQSNYAVKIEVL
ncbi:MAG TPA: hypothetical protein VK211_21370 [Kamptonema sp.]|nr:hypothetical protein [Kamptonema sp.]